MIWHTYLCPLQTRYCRYIFLMLGLVSNRRDSLATLAPVFLRSNSCLELPSLLPTDIFQCQISQNWHFSKAFGIEKIQFYLLFGIKKISAVFTVWHLIFFETVNKTPNLASLIEDLAFSNWRTWHHWLPWLKQRSESNRSRSSLSLSLHPPPPPPPPVRFDGWGICAAATTVPVSVRGDGEPIK